MHKYHAGSYTSAVNNNAIGGSSARDTSRIESSPILPNFSNPRRPLQLVPYRLRCEKEVLNSRLGPPDFHPQSPNCPEETLTKDYVQSGYRETVEGLEEAREISLSQVQFFTKPITLKCKETIRKCHRAINESRAQKRKAGQVYGKPLNGPLLNKPGIFPEQRPCGEDFRRKWIEGLSQQHKRLRTLAENVPHGYRKTSLFEVIIRNNVPLLRATWFIKVTYLNQIRPGSSSISSGVQDKSHISRSEQWTKDIIEYLQVLLDDFVSRKNSYPSTQTRERSPQVTYNGLLQQKNDVTATAIGVEEPSLHFKWWYVVQMLQWHHIEGLVVPSLIIDWVLNQLQEKELFGVLQLLLPIIYGVIESVILCQTYVRALVGVAIRFIQEPSPGSSDLVDNSRRAYITSALVEMLRYLILVVPDTFVALDCFPLPSCVVTHVANGGGSLLKLADTIKAKRGPLEVACALQDKRPEVQLESLSIDRVVSSIQKCSENLSVAARPGRLGRNVAKALQALDTCLVHGDLKDAYSLLFENPCYGTMDECWISEVSSCLRSSLKYIGSLTLPFICSVFLVCEWATSDFRDFRSAAPRGLKFSGRRDFSQIYVAIRLLNLRLTEMKISLQSRNAGSSRPVGTGKGSDQLCNYSSKIFGAGFCSSDNGGKSKNLQDIFESPSALHDIVVCWIDQHEWQTGEGLKRLQLLIIELIRAGIFYPQAYVRQLIVCGIMDCRESAADLARQKRHHRILKHLPGPCVLDALEEAQITEFPILAEAVRVYMNERRLVLRRLSGNNKIRNGINNSYQSQKHHCSARCETASAAASEQCSQSASNSLSKDVHLEELKASIAILLQFPTSLSTYSGFDDTESLKKTSGSTSNRSDLIEGSPGCEECSKAKRQKLTEGNLYVPSYLPDITDDEDFWWLRRGQKSPEIIKADPPAKPVKQASRGRQKIVRKTQSLAQLAATRIESSQGASTSHVCDSRLNCPHHGSSVDRDAHCSGDGIRSLLSGDFVSIGVVLKKLEFIEKRAMMLWLTGVVKQLVEEAEKTASKVGQYGRAPSSVDDRSSFRWKLSEDELSTILYLMDVSDELVLVARFLVWLLPKAFNGPVSSTHGSRTTTTVPRNAENRVCEVGEAYIVSSLRRYENVIIAADLLPDVLSAAMQRVALVMALNGRVSGSPAMLFARYLLRKYGTVASVVEWEKNWKSTSDRRLSSELESGKSTDGEFGFALGVPSGVGDLDEFFRQKITGVRMSRVGLGMKDTVQRHVDDVCNHFYGKERKQVIPNTSKSMGFERWEDCYQVAHQIVTGLIECMRQTGGAAQEGDPTLVSSAISAIISNIGQVITKVPDLATSNSHLQSAATSSSLYFARCLLRIHVTCLCLLKEALGDRQSRVFEVALATEASSALAQVIAPGKAPRGQFQLSAESHDSSTNFSGRAAKSAAAISALVVGAVLQGVASLERMVILFRLKEGLDIIQFFRSIRSNSNGNARSVGPTKGDNLVAVSVFWFRVLVGNCRTVSDGLFVDLLGEASVVALSRMQRSLPLNLVFPAAYSIFGFVIWKPFILSPNSASRDDIQLLYQSLTMAITDTIKHVPFREVCFRNTRGFYDLMAAHAVDSELASLLDSHGADMHAKVSAFVPLRSRLFLNAFVDCKMPQQMLKQDDGNRAAGKGESKVQHTENDLSLRDKLLHTLDTLQPAKFHWQWIELRLLLNEQSVIEKLDVPDASLVEAVRSVSANPDNSVASENERNFIQIILARLPVRPDAAPLFSEVVHLLGRSLEDSMLSQTRWFLGGFDVLYGRQSIRQRLLNFAESNNLSTKKQYWKPWGWCNSSPSTLTDKADKWKFEVTSLEEGEVADERANTQHPARGSTPVMDVEGYLVNEQRVTERAFVEFVLPCLEQGSDDSRNAFASEMIKQMNSIEQHINTVTREASKPAGAVTSGVESPAIKGNSRKAMRGGSPGQTRRPPASADTVPPSPVALRGSMLLRLQFILKLLSLICSDGEPSGRNMRHTLASVILRLLGSRVVYEGACDSFNPTSTLSKRVMDTLMEPSVASSAPTVLSAENLFDHLLLVLHGLLSSYKPSWLKLKSRSKSTSEYSKDFNVFDHDVVVSLQNELEQMQLPDSIRWRIQTSMPFLFPSVQCSISCQPPSVSPSSLMAFQPSNPISVLHSSNSSMPQRNSGSLLRSATNLSGKNKSQATQHDLDSNIDPWAVLEDGAGSGQSSSSSTVASGDHANLKASNWLKGAVRVRRTDLTYIGAVDEDS